MQKRTVSWTGWFKEAIRVSLALTVTMNTMNAHFVRLQQHSGRERSGRATVEWRVQTAAGEEQRASKLCIVKNKQQTCTPTVVLLRCTAVLSTRKEHPSRTDLKAEQRAQTVCGIWVNKIFLSLLCVLSIAAALTINHPLRSKLMNLSIKKVQQSLSGSCL